MRHAATEVAELVMPSDEDERIKELHDYGILDTSEDWAFDNLTELAAKYFNTKIAIVSLVDSC